MADALPSPATHSNSTLTADLTADLTVEPPRGPVADPTLQRASGRHRVRTRRTRRTRGRRVTPRSQRLGWLPLLPLHLLVVAVCVPDTSTSSAVSLAHVTAADVAAVLVVVAAAWRLLSGDGPALLRSRALLPTLAVLLAVTLSAVFATDQRLAAAGWVRWVEVDVLLPVAAFVLCRTVRATTGVLLTFLAVSLAEGVLGVVQYLTGTGAGYGAEAIRAIGTFGVGNQLAMGNLVADAGLVCLAGALALPVRRHRLVAGALAVFFLLPLLLSLSRGALLSGLVAAVLVLARVGWRVLAGTALAGIAVATVALVAVPSQGAVVVARVETVVSSASSPDQSVADRYGLWSAALRMWSEDPVTGIGVKNFSEHRDSQLGIATSSGADAASDDSYERVQLLSPHEQYLLVLSEQGLLGLLAYLSLVVVAALGPLRRYDGRPSLTSATALALFGVGTQFVVTNFWGDLAGPTAPLQGVVFGLALRMAATPRTPRDPRPGPRRPVEPVDVTGLRVLHVCQPVDAGVAAFVARAAEQQRAAGLDVVVACAPTGWLADRLDALGVERATWPAVRSPLRGVLPEARRLRAVVRAVDPDVVHLHSAKAGLVGRLVVHGSRPTAFQPHAWAFEAATGPVALAVRLWEALALHLTDCLVLVSRAELDRAREAGLPLDVTARRVVRNGLDLRRHGVDDATDARRELGLPDAPTVVCVGRLAHQKGQDRLLAAWPLVRAAVPQARLALVGDGPDADDLRRRVAVGGAELSGVLLPGATDTPRRWYAAADVVVVPSRYEGFAFVPLEAMAARRSLVVHDHPALREALPPGAGAVVDTDDAALLATALVRRLLAPEVRDQEGAVGRAHVVTTRDDLTVLPQLVDAYLAAGASVPAQEVRP
ncbi:glycosyltransferase [Kineococcus sp. NPDC059986]|uniref:glycosyltransferase n=1 Tax=Kineococcus sp. NPDC059986 TaxID=3155538 RepID=UPI00344D32BA